jgi:hypothetical protein
MSQFRITMLIDQDEWVPATVPDQLFPSMAKAFSLLERSVEAQDGGRITRSFYKGDTLTLFGRANGYDCAWQIVPAEEVLS